MEIERGKKLSRKDFDNKTEKIQMEQPHIIRGLTKPEYSPLNSCLFLKHNDEEEEGAPAPAQVDVSGGIEMMVVPTVSYTSLRDIMPHPTNASWNEIPIKNPLLKQAALAYLQPMSTPPDVENKGFLDKFREKCFCGGGGAATSEVGCFWWLNGGVFAALLGAFFGFFCERTRNRNEGQQSEDEDEDEDEEDEDADEDEDNVE